MPVVVLSLFIFMQRWRFLACVFVRGGGRITGRRILVLWIWSCFVYGTVSIILVDERTSNREQRVKTKFCFRSKNGDNRIIPAIISN